MVGIMLVVLLEASKISHGWQDYDAAYWEMERTGRPMVVLVTAEWCGPCRQLKSNVLPDPQIKGLLRDYTCAMVDLDQEPSLAQQLGGSEGVPFMAVYVPDGDGWKRRTLRGYQSVDSLAQFLRGD